MTNEQYETLLPQKEYINIFFKEKTWGGNIEVLNNVATQLGYKTNLGCNQCKADLVNYMYHRIVEYENSIKTA